MRVFRWDGWKERNLNRQSDFKEGTNQTSCFVSCQERPVHSHHDSQAALLLFYRQQHHVDHLVHGSGAEAGRPHGERGEFDYHDIVIRFPFPQHV